MPVLEDLKYEIKRNATYNTKREERKRLYYNIKIDEQPGENRQKRSNIEKKGEAGYLKDTRKIAEEFA